LGTLIGGLVEALARPELDEAPLRGMGYGSALGVLTLGALAPSLKMSASRVLFVDLSAGLGALTGAALASPVLFVGDDVTEQRSRVWFASVIGGTLLGAGVGTWMTRGEADAEDASSAPGARPYVGVIGFDRSRSDSPKPIFGGTLDGEW